MKTILCLSVVVVLVVGWVALQINQDMATWKHAVIDKHTQEVAQ